MSALCGSLSHCAWVALDTEFIRETTYYPQLCLLQVATQQSVVCVDPLLIDSLTPLLDILYRKNITKVFHSAYQDLEIFYHLRGAPLSPVFDTQIGASMLGYGTQIGYADLVQQLLGVTLDKSHTRTDWSSRPLSDVQIRYAADDVRYLRGLYLKQTNTLTENGRDKWLSEDAARLYNAKRFEVSLDDVWQRVRGHSKLNRRQLAVLRNLAAWRESEARTQNRPRRWILADSVLVTLARSGYQHKGSLSNIRGLPKKMVRRFGEQLIKTINAALIEPEECLPQHKWRPPLTAEQEALINTMMALVRHQASVNRLHPGVLATRSQLEKLVLGNYDVPVLSGWRATIIGQTLQNLLHGLVQISFENGLLKMQDRQYTN